MICKNGSVPVFVSSMLEKIYSVCRYVRRDDNLRVVSAAVPSISVRSATVFNGYREAVIRCINDAAICAGMSPFVAYRCCGRIKSTTKVREDMSCKDVGGDAGNMSRFADTFISDDFDLLASSVKGDGFDLMLFGGDGGCIDYSHMCRSSVCVADNVSRVECCEEGDVTDYSRKNNIAASRHKYKLKPDVSILVVDLAVGLGNESPYPFGPLAADIDSEYFDVDIVLFVGGDNNRACRDDIEEIFLCRNESVQFFYAEKSLLVSQNNAGCIFFGSSEFMGDVRSIAKSQGVNLIDCVSFAEKHKYGAAEIKKLTDKVANKYDVRLQTTKQDYDSIISELRGGVDININASDVDVGDSSNTINGVARKKSKSHGRSRSNDMVLKRFMQCADIFDVTICGSDEFCSVVVSLLQSRRQAQ